MAVSKYQSKPETSVPNTPTETQSYFDPVKYFHLWQIWDFIFISNRF